MAALFTHDCATALLRPGGEVETFKKINADLLVDTTGGAGPVQSAGSVHCSEGGRGPEEAPSRREKRCRNSTVSKAEVGQLSKKRQQKRKILALT